MMRPLALLLACGLGFGSLPVAPVAAQETSAPAVPQAEAPAAVPPPAPDARPDQVIDLSTVPATLMLSIEEMIAVEAAIAAGPLARVDGPRLDDEEPDRFRLRANLYVSSIVYFSPASWTVWINGYPLRPGSRTDLFEVVEVRPDKVRLAIPWGEGGTRDIVLAPHQTFVPRVGAVVEGQFR